MPATDPRAQFALAVSRFGAPLARALCFAACADDMAHFRPDYLVARIVAAPFDGLRCGHSLTAGDLEARLLRARATLIETRGEIVRSGYRVYGSYERMYELLKAFDAAIARLDIAVAETGADAQGPGYLLLRNGADYACARPVLDALAAAAPEPSPDLPLPAPLRADVRA